MSEAAGEHDGIDVGQVLVAMPYECCVAAERFDRFDDVVLTVGTGEEHHADSVHVRLASRPWMADTPRPTRSLQAEPIRLGRSAEQI